MTPTKIYLDIDGPCNRLIMHALEINGCGVSRWRDDQYPLPGNYDITAAANELLARRYGQRLQYVTRQSFFANVTRHVWANTPASAEFGWLLNACVELVGQQNVAFLTAPIEYDPDCSAGKHEWILRHAPSYMHDQFLIAPTKHFCAAAGHLLIDDSDANVREFRQHGGQAILFPRPWNSRHAESPSVVLKELYFAFYGPPLTPLQRLGLVPKPRWLPALAL